MKKSYTNLLYAKPGFLSGIARALDIAGIFDSYNDSPTGSMADYMAIKSDWKTIGNDLRNIMNTTPVK